MPLKIDTYDVLFLRDGEQVETSVTVYKTDELRAELEGRRFGLRGPVSDGKTVTDLGDHENNEALNVWAALVRTEQYAGKSPDFRLRDCLAFAKRRGEETVDPTRPGISTDSASPAPPSSEDSTSG